MSIQLEPAEQLLAAALRLALRDASQDKDRRLRADALRFLWSTAPTVAVRANLPAVTAHDVDLIDELWRGIDGAGSGGNTQ